MQQRLHAQESKLTPAVIPKLLDASKENERLRKENEYLLQQLRLG